MVEMCVSRAKLNPLSDGSVSLSSHWNTAIKLNWNTAIKLNQSAVVWLDAYFEQNACRLEISR
jgi:hypothetical protein